MVQAPAVPVQRSTMTGVRLMDAVSPDVRWAATATATLKCGIMYSPSLTMTDMGIIRNWSIRTLIQAWDWSAWLLWSRAWTPCLQWIPIRLCSVSYTHLDVYKRQVYAIIALGYTMVYGIAKMLNFAHGDVIMIGSYVVFVTVSTMGFPPMVGVLVAVLACTLLGMTIERIAYKPLRGASPLAVLITAIGVSYLLQNVALLI